MPYIIETRYADCPTPRECGECDISRTAVATLEEARETAFAMAVESRQREEAFDIGESGGMIGPLPDGTMIEVRPVGWFDFERMAVDPEDAADVDIATFDSDEYRDSLLAAFNAS